MAIKGTIYGTGTQGSTRTLIWSMEASGSNYTNNPTTKSWGAMTQGLTGVNFVPKANWPHNGKNWARLIFTSKNKPWVQWAVANHSMNNYGNYANVERIIDTFCADSNVWGSGNTMTISTKYNIRLCCGSVGRICTDNCIIEHNNSSGNENWDIPTIGEDNGNHVWGDGMIWGNIDNATNYGGFLNTDQPHSGSSGGATGDTLEIYMDTYYPKANDYVDILNSTESTGRSWDMSWSESHSVNTGGQIKYLGFQSDRFTSANWGSHGRQQGGMSNGDANMTVDLGAENAQVVDFAFAIGYPGRQHASDNNYIKASNDGSNWDIMAEWKHHPAGGSGTNTSYAGGGAGDENEGYSGGYLWFQEGGHCYSNTVNNVEKWIPLRQTNTAYRYWRIGGSNWSNHGNGYQLLMNWGLMKKKDTIDARGSWQEPFKTLQDADNAGVPDGHYWFINPLGYKEHCYVAMFEDQTGYPSNSGSRWMLVSSNNANTRRIPSGTNRNNNSYKLGCGGSQQLGVANPDSDYIIGEFIEQFKFAECKIYGFGWGSCSDSGVQSVDTACFKYNDRECLSMTWRPATGNRDHTNGTYYPNPLASRTHKDNVQTHASASEGYYNFTYAVVDSVRMDSGLNANSSQSTVGGSANGTGDPSGGNYIGHGTGEGFFEGWYPASGGAVNCQGYTTWVR